MTKEVIVKEAMKTNLVMVEPTTTVLEAAKRMKKNTACWNTYRE